MATCPHCGAYLETNHRCRGLWRLRLRVWGLVGLGGLIGAGAVAVASFALYGGPSGLALGIGALIGSLVMHTYLRGEP